MVGVGGGEKEEGRRREGGGKKGKATETPRLTVYISRLNKINLAPD